MPYGYTPGEPTAAEQAILDRNGIEGFPLDRVRGRAVDAAAEALWEASMRAEGFVVRFHVDVVDFVDFPVSDVSHISTRLTLAKSMVSVGVFAASPRFAGLVITEFNPDHDKEKGTLGGSFLVISRTRSPPDARSQHLIFLLSND